MAKNWTHEERLGWSKNETMKSLEEQTLRHIKMLAQAAKDKEGKDVLSKIATTLQGAGEGAKHLGEGMQQAARSAGEFKTQMTGIKDTLQNLDNDQVGLEEILDSLNDDLAQALKELLDKYYHEESEEHDEEEHIDGMCSSCEKKMHEHEEHEHHEDEEHEHKEHEHQEEMPVIMVEGLEIGDDEFNEAKDALLGELKGMVSKAVDDKDIKLAYQIERTIDAILEDLNED